MKGGKAGRPRRGAASGTGHTGAGRGKPKNANPSRREGLPPKKGSRKKPEFGWRSTSGDE
jgi:hypothetical protein